MKDRNLSTVGPVQKYNDAPATVCTALWGTSSSMHYSMKEGMVLVPSCGHSHIATPFLHPFAARRHSGYRGRPQNLA